MKNEHLRFDPDDPQLTAYALGELEAEEAARYAALVAGSEDAQRYVQGLQATATVLGDELRGGEAVGLSADQRSEVEERIGDGAPAPILRGPWWRPRGMQQWSAAALVVLALGAAAAWTIQGELYDLAPGAASRDMSASVATEAAPDAPVELGELGPIGYLGEGESLRYRKDTSSALRNLGYSGKTEESLKSGVEAEYDILEDGEVVMMEALGYGEAPDASPTLSAPATSPPAPDSAAPLAARRETEARPSAGRQYADGDSGELSDELRRSVAAPADSPYETAKRGRPGSGPSAPGALHDRRTVKDDLRALDDEDDDGLERVRDAVEPFNREAYDRIHENPFRVTADAPLSTFSIDVDTASYANVRRYLERGQLPPPDAVRIEELINYFDYDYPPPSGFDPFSVNVEVASAPWTPENRLVRIGLKGQEIFSESRQPLNLVFLIDVSGSMSDSNKLPLLKQSMRLLVDNLDSRDRVAMVVYAGSSGLVLPSTPASQRGQILGALDRLKSGGSTNGGAGIELAYKVALENRVEGGVNRVILATDGDFNVGVSDRGQLVRMIEEKAREKTFLSVLGFGMGNLQDATLEQLADKGNGNYAYIDTLAEARKVLVEQMGGTLVTIAKDVKIQVEFNPFEVAAYRLIGYENRMLAAQDFNDDKKDAGEIGAGHSVTALYEIVPAGRSVDVARVDPLRYQGEQQPSAAAASGELMTVKLRFKTPEGDVSTLREYPVTDSGTAWELASPEFKFATAVAGYGMLLRGSRYSGSLTPSALTSMATAGLGVDPSGYRYEFLRLAAKAAELLQKRGDD